MKKSLVRIHKNTDSGFTIEGFQVITQAEVESIQEFFDSFMDNEFIIVEETIAIDESDLTYTEVSNQEYKMLEKLDLLQSGYGTIISDILARVLPIESSEVSLDDYKDEEEKY